MAGPRMPGQLSEVVREVVHEEVVHEVVCKAVCEAVREIERWSLSTRLASTAYPHGLSGRVVSGAYPVACLHDPHSNSARPHILRTQFGSAARQWSSAAQLRSTQSSTTQLDSRARQRSSTAQLVRAACPARLCPHQAWPRANVREPGSACTTESTEFASAADRLHCSPPTRAGRGRSASAPSLASVPSLLSVKC
jgi:hypothetical protein